ncbi:MAG: molybdenum cofactor biosynthesis protein MoaE [Halobacteriota archaeon]
MRVIALTGQKQTCGHFLEMLTHQGSVATIGYGVDEKRVFTREAAKNFLCIKSPSSYVLRQCTSSGVHDVMRELDRLAEQGDTDFAAVTGNALAAEIASVREVYKARLEVSANIDKHLELLASTPEWVTLGTLIEAVRLHRDIDKAGAILTFTGIVRGDALALEFDIYDGQAQQRIDSIIRELADTEGIVDVKIHHKAGRIERGEDIVYIVVAAAHRQDGFKALRDAIERLKKEVPIWKKELTEHGEKWVDVG